MLIKEVTVNATASKNYQKVEISIAASIENENDIDTLQTLAIKKALIGINKLTSDNVEEPKVETKVQPVEQPIQNHYKRDDYGNISQVQRPATPSYYANAPQNKPYNPQSQHQSQSGPKLASPKQIEMLKKFHYNCDWQNLTSAEASQMIQEALGKNG